MNGNGLCSLAEIDKGLRDAIGIAELFDAKPAIIRAFNFAKNYCPAKPGQKNLDDYIQFSEFRVFLVALRQRFEYLMAFRRVDLDNDGRIDIDEFKACQ